jgi:DNA polymerase sliding clamp subunit (PCNA homolog)
MYFSIHNYSLLRKLHTLYESINFNGLSNLITFEFSDKNQLKITWGLDSKNLVYTYINIKKYNKNKEKITLSIKLMMDILTTFSNEKLYIKKKKNTLNIYSKHGTYEVPIFCNSNYDQPLTHRSIFVKINLCSNIFLKILNNTLFIEDVSELKPILNGVFFQFFYNKANFISTDTYRLVKYTIKNIKTNKNVQFTISRKYLSIIKTILKKEKKSFIVIEYYDNNNIIFRFKNHIFSCQLINEKYPNFYSTITHNECKASVIINKFLLLNTIKRICVFSKRKNKFVNLHFNHEKLKIRDQNRIDRDSPVSEIQCKTLFKKVKNIKIGFNSQFLIEILSFLNEDFIYFELYDKMGILRPSYNKNKKEKESIFILIMSTIKV